MAFFTTGLRRGAPFANRVTLMGRVLDIPHMKQDKYGDIAAIYLHIPGNKNNETDVVDMNMTGTKGPVYPSLFTTDDFTGYRTAVPILVRGQTARWCTTHLQMGMMLLVDARLHALGTTDTDACLTHIEAEHLQLICEHFPPAVSARPDTPPHFGPTFSSFHGSMSTN